MTNFTVDTQLFRELGELLVGRDSTALIELIKNAYDADAEEVIVYGERLTDAVTGNIIVRDTGNGMTAEQFESGFLRVASRAKQTDDRRSPVLRRRYTGEKGIGRLPLTSSRALCTSSRCRVTSLLGAVRPWTRPSTGIRSRRMRRSTKSAPTPCASLRVPRRRGRPTARRCACRPCARPGRSATSVTSWPRCRHSSPRPC